MKKILFVFIFIGSMVLKLNAQEKFVCQYDEWADHFTDNLKLTELLKNACTEINKGGYQRGSELLTEAVALSSVDNDGEPNAYFDAQLRRLKYFIDNSDGTDGLDSAVTVEPITPDEKVAVETEPVEVVSLEPIEPIAGPAVVGTAVVGTSVSVNENETSVSEVKNSEIPATTTENSIIVVQDTVDDKTNTLSEESEPEAEIIFTETQLAEFRTKGEQKIRQFEGFIFQIGNKNSPATLVNQAIDNTVSLFDREDRTIQVSSIHRSEKPKYKIKVYLQRIKNLNYDEVQIEWADFQYASNFTKGKDENYYAYVILTQRFIGYKDNKVVYQDITRKRQEIILKFYEKAVQGELTDNWDVFLGDMSVVHTAAE